jgi:conjugative transfer region protein TrbK
MDGKMLARLGAIVFVAFVITVTAIEWSRKEDAPPASLPVLVLPHEADPLRESQLRCQLLGQKAANDAECLRVWAEMRNRFLGKTSPPASSPSSEGR